MMFARLVHLSTLLFAVCLLWSAAEGCDENSTIEATLASLHLSSCVTEIIRAVCGALRPAPIKRNTELINSILGLPRVLQDAGR